MASYYLNMSATESGNIFSDTWAESLTNTIIDSRTIGLVYAESALVGPSPLGTGLVYAGHSVYYSNLLNQLVRQFLFCGFLFHCLSFELNGLLCV